MQAEVAFAGNGHTQRSVGEHLNSDEFSARAFDAFAHYGLVDGFDLVQVKLPCEHHHIRKLRIEAQRLGVGYGQLGGNMDLHPYLPAIGYRCHIGSNHGRNACLPGCIESLTHLLQVLGI